MNHDNSMLPFEVAYSVKLGNRIARKLYMQQWPRPSADAAIRHMRAEQGTGAAIRLARELLGLSDADASALVARLAKTKPNDIVSPHFE